LDSKTRCSQAAPAWRTLEYSWYLQEQGNIRTIDAIEIPGTAGPGGWAGCVCVASSGGLTTTRVAADFLQRTKNLETSLKSQASFKNGMLSEMPPLCVSDPFVDPIGSLRRCCCCCSPFFTAKMLLCGFKHQEISRSLELGDPCCQDARNLAVLVLAQFSPPLLAWYD
jgi:hypothetical protein